MRDLLLNTQDRTNHPQGHLLLVAEGILVDSFNHHVKSLRRLVYNTWWQYVW